MCAAIRRAPLGVWCQVSFLGTRPGTQWMLSPLGLGDMGEGMPPVQLSLTMFSICQFPS